MPNQIEPDREYLTTPQAAQRSGLSKNYLTQLLRKGVLEGFQLSRDWLIYTDSLERFLATSRKPGPKGPRKKVAQKHPGTTAANNNGDDANYGS